LTPRPHFSHAGEARFLFETLSYFIGFGAYLRPRKRRGDVVTEGRRRDLIAAALVGAAARTTIIDSIYLIAAPASCKLLPLSQRSNISNAKD